MKIRMLNRRGGFGSLALGISLLALVPGSGFLAADCFSVQVDSPVRMPDGSVYDAHSITLCDSRALTPVSHVHTTMVDGEPVGMLMSVRRTTEGRSGGRPAMVFLRRSDGILDLLGYAVPGSGEQDVTYTLSRSYRPGKRLARSRRSSPSSPAWEPLTADAGSLPLLVLQAAAR